MTVPTVNPTTNSTPRPDGTAPTIVFLITEDWAFLSHRKNLADACLARGWTVVLATHVTRHAEEIRRMGCIVEPLPLDRGGANPFRELRTVLALIGVLRRHRPDILHAVALKPVIYGGLAARLIGVPHPISALAGMGYAFTGASAKVRMLRAGLSVALRLLVPHPAGHVIVQNGDDRDLLLGSGIAVAHRLTLIPGSGVDLARLSATQAPDNDPPVFAIVSRMLRDKGIVEAVEAVRLLRCEGVRVRLWLVGDVDPANPSSLTPEDLAGWQADGLVEWLGRRDDIAAIWRAADVAVLPSYREGMPKALLEAAACGRPIITTDVTGCRDVIVSGEEGLVVPVRDPVALAAAMRRLASDGALREVMGRAARRRAEARFGEDRVVAAHLAIYDHLLGVSVAS